MPSMIERVAVAETTIANISEKLDHVHSCTEKLKRQVWFASGASSAFVILIQLALKHF